MRKLLALSLFLFTLVLLSVGLTDYGITWDEAETNYPAARNQALWFTGFVSGETSLTETSIRQYFETESDHPSLPRTAMALSRCLFPKSVSDRFAFRFPTALLLALFTSAFFWWLSSRLCPIASLAATLFLLFHPRWFAHAHLAEYDILIAICWWASAATFYEAAELSPHLDNKNKWQRAVLASSMFAVALSVKLHAFFLPFPFLVWVLVFRKWDAWRWAVSSAVLGPVVYLVSQPYLWWNTLERLQNRFLDYSTKVPITTFYLGEWYPGNVPWHYPWVLLWATLPVGFFLFLSISLVRFRGVEKEGSPDPRQRSRWVFLLLNAVTTPLIFSWKSPYDGIRLFLAALPFLAAFAAEGVDFSTRWTSRKIGRWNLSGIPAGIAIVFVLMQGVACYRIHPFQLAYYSPLVGGIRGAHRLGFETTYWCDSLTDSFVERIAEKYPETCRMQLHALDPPPFLELQREGKAPLSWRFNQAGLPDIHILQFRQGFFGPVEARLLRSGFEVLAENSVAGVPLVRAYERPLPGRSKTGGS